MARKMPGFSLSLAGSGLPCCVCHGCRVLWKVTLLMAVPSTKATYLLSPLPPLPDDDACYSCIIIAHLVARWLPSFTATTAHDNEACYSCLVIGLLLACCQPSFTTTTTPWQWCMLLLFVGFFDTKVMLRFFLSYLLDTCITSLCRPSPYYMLHPLAQHSVTHIAYTLLTPWYTSQ